MAISRTGRSDEIRTPRRRTVDIRRLRAAYRRRCVCCAVSLASGSSYLKIWIMLERLGCGHPDVGIDTERTPFRRFMQSLGFRLVNIRHHRGLVRLRSGDIPLGRLVVLTRNHAAAVIDRTLYDTHDSTRCGQAIVRAYYIYEGPPGRPPRPPSASEGITAMMARLTKHIRRALQDHEYHYCLDEDCKQRALNAVRGCWPNVDERRWGLAVERALTLVHECYRSRSDR